MEKFEQAWLDDPRMMQRDACGVGFIASIKGQKSYKTLTEGLDILCRMDHRGGRAADDLTSDGAGILTQIPHELFRAAAFLQEKHLPEPGAYAVAQFFLPKNKLEQNHWDERIDALAKDQGVAILLCRPVPVDPSVLGPVAKANEPETLQWIFTDRQADSKKSFTWRLYMLRKLLEEEARQRYGIKQLDFYCVSLSTETICYKGLILAKDLANYYQDLQNPLFSSAFAMVHQRFSTNTHPAWPLAQPFRTICHNGEINTLRGNMNAMHARSRLFQKDGIDDDLARIGPICTPGLSDSAMLDNSIEFMVNAGRPLHQVLSMVIPEPWDANAEMNQDLKDYYEYHSYMMEPWDGPAFIGFADGQKIGAILDRNGLRPGRYWVTADDYVIMASETGVLNRRPQDIVLKGRLSPGRMFLVDMQKATIVPDHSIKQSLAHEKPYGQWLQHQRRHLNDLPLPSTPLEAWNDSISLLQRQQLFGYSKEDLRLILAPMANEGKEPVGSMGNDTPIAVLSKQRPLLYNYFKQLFAQVTNPPIDAIREVLVTSLAIHLGSEANLLDETPEHCHVLRLKQPMLSDPELQKILALKEPGLLAKRVDSLYQPSLESLSQGIKNLQDKVAMMIGEGVRIIILSDRNLDAVKAPIPALLATSAVHHEMIRRGLRTQISLVVESGEPREVHHFALLIGYGASAINPYLALAIIAKQSTTDGFDASQAALSLQKQYLKAASEGVLKIMSKMGISTLQSYHGAQIFEALGLHQDFIDAYFTWTLTRIAGLGINDFDADCRYRQQLAFGPATQYSFSALPQGAQYHWRRNGEAHLHSPAMIANLQEATRINSRAEFKKFCATLDDQSRQFLNIRGLLRFKSSLASIPLEEVEAASSIVKRFATGAMSFGSISKETHETIAIAMNRLGARSNSGEGGEDPARFIPSANGDLKRSAIKQVASARFGVTSHYLINADELQIKIAQGAKPGEGGQLPGPKVDQEIARVRHSTPGITLISPPPHHDIYSIEDLAQLIFDLKNANRQARISVKLVSEVGVGTIASGVSKAKADVILIAGYEGGTGASPISSIKHAGLPWELGLVEAHRSLVENRLRGRVILQVDGQLRTPRDIAIAALLGAEEWGIGTGALITMGCIMMRKCHLNTCPVGIATQDPELRSKFRGQPEHLINYFFLLADGLREIMAQLGIRTIREMVGRSDLLEKIPVLENDRAAKLDLSAILSAPHALAEEPRVNVTQQNHELDLTLDARELLLACEPALSKKNSVKLQYSISNIDRAVGTMLSSEISRRHGGQGLRDHSIHINFKGSAGQSFMAFGAKGITAVLEGDVNDYCGKGLSGARLVVIPPLESRLIAEENVICGNVSLYGATSGSLFVRGLAGERFAVRNSGAHAVVEGLGDHGCEYMTGGSVIVIGPIGRNFAAGMSGGLAYVYDAHASLHRRVNTELVEISQFTDPEDESFVVQQLKEHLRCTQSDVAARILKNWQIEKSKFLCVVPTAFRALLRKQRHEQEQPSVHFIAGDNLGVALEGGAYHG